MNDLIKTENDEEDIVALWEATKRKQAEIDSKSSALDRKIKSECMLVQVDAGKFYDEELKKGSKGLQRSIQERDKYRAKLSNSVALFYLFAVIILALGIIVKNFVYDFVIANNFLTYVLIIAASLIISKIILGYRKTIPADFDNLAR